MGGGMINCYYRGSNNIYGVLGGGGVCMLCGSLPDLYVIAMLKLFSIFC